MKKQVAALYRKIQEEKLLATLVVTFWLFLFLTTVSKTYSYVVRNDIPIGMGYILTEVFLIWGLVTIFVPLFVWLANKYPIEKEKRYRNVAIHISISLVLVPVHALFFEFIMSILHGLLVNVQSDKLPWDWGTLDSYLGTLIWMGFIGTFSYWLVVGGCHLERYFTQFKERQLKNMKLEAELSTIRLHVLKSQLHPHFLFNTLHNINTLIHEDPPTAERILQLLKRFLQRSIQKVHTQQVSFAEEMAFTDIYLEIEKIRFSNHLSLQRNIEPDILEALVPSLMLQPLVENAIRHGISKKRKPGILSIKAHKSDCSLEMIVEDNGPGLRQKEVNAEGVGLKNIRQRLLNLYKEPFFELGDSSLGGLKVTIRIPFNSL